MTFRRSLRLPIQLLLSVGALAAFSPLACSNEPGFTDGEPQCNNPELEDECGKSCEATSDCADGLFCDSNFDTCQAECVAGEDDSDDCDGAACSSDGKCEGRPGGTGGGINVPGGGGGGEGNTGNNPECIDVQVDFEPQIPNVVLLIDRSGSMNAGDGFGTAVQAEITAGTYVPWGCPNNAGDPPDDPDQDNPTWRWNVVRNVLFNPTVGVVKPLEDKVRFGSALYDSPGSGTCPRIIENEDGIAFGTHQDMLDTMVCSQYGSNTPTRQSLAATADALAAADLDGPKVIVLATDGEPDNCTCRNWDDNAGPTCDDDAGNFVMRGGVSMSPEHAEQYDVVQEAARIQDELGITVHVIDVSSPTNTALRAHLTDVAEAGGGDIFDGLNPSNLTTAFQTIINGVRSCKIDLDGEIAPGKESTGTVTLNGDALVLNDPDGWRVNSPTQIELRGDACDTIKSGDQALDISFPCGSFVPPLR